VKNHAQTAEIKGERGREDLLSEKNPARKKKRDSHIGYLGKVQRGRLGEGVISQRRIFYRVLTDAGLHRYA